jgi:hypothetical protein
MASMATVTYVSPKGRKMARDVMDHDFAGILKYARNMAAKTGVKSVKVWSQGGKLLASPRA